MLPSRDNRSIALFKRNVSYGPELLAFYETPVHGWLPMISCWPCDPDVDVNEDQISINGMHFAYCISDNVPADYDDLIPIVDPSDCDMPTAMMVLGILTARVI